MASYIIFGKTEEERLARAEALIGKNSQGVDLIIMAEAKGIDAVREITKTLSRKPYQSKAVSVIIPNADGLGVEAQNALLKTLEESPGESNLVLLSSNPESLLPTVRSRAQLLDLGPAESELTERDLRAAWQIYRRGSLADLYDISGETSPVVWAELGRQILLYQLGGEALLKKTITATKLTDFVATEDLEKVAAQSSVGWHRFLTLTQWAQEDLKANVNHKLVLENLFLELPTYS